MARGPTWWAFQPTKRRSKEQKNQLQSINKQKKRNHRSNKENMAKNPKVLLEAENQTLHNQLGTLEAHRFAGHRERVLD